jgi:type I restriction enzyme S subunit
MLDAVVKSLQEFLRRKAISKSRANTLLQLGLAEPVGYAWEAIRELPESWCWTTVNRISVFVTDGDHNPPKRVPRGVPHLTARNVKGWQLRLEDSTFISNEDFEIVRKRYDPEEGDLIVTCVGTIGETAIVPRGFHFSADRNLAAIRLPTGSLLPETLQYILNASPWRDILKDMSGSTAQPHLYLKDLRSLVVPLIPTEEQYEIVRQVERLLNIAATLERRIATGTQKAEQLALAILAKAFRGELVPTEADLSRGEDRSYESATELLVRIRKEQPSPVETDRKGRMTSMARRTKISKPSARRQLVAVLAGAKKRMTPDELFAQAGFDENSVEDFYEELRAAIAAGKIAEKRPNNTEAYLEATAS